MRKYFGTDGIRRIANTELTPELVFRVAKAGAYVLASHTDHTPTILIGRDTRISGTLIESAMVAGFLSYGANVKLLGVIPTPAVAYLTRKMKADAGVVISASHNTFEFNGIKFFSNKGMKISDALEEEMEEIMDSGKLNEYTAVNEKIGVSTYVEDLQQEYVDFLTNLVKEKLNGKKKDSFRVAIDVANGATYQVAEKIFTNLEIPHTILSNHPDGININQNCGSTHLESIKEYVVKHGYMMGIAYDGDGDRCLLVDDEGNTVDGDQILALLASSLKEKGDLKKDTIVATVMSNLGLKKYTEKEQLHLVETKVGDRYVLETMLEHGYNLGGEQSGHLIFLDYNPTGDGILTSLMVICTLLEKNKTLKEATSNMTIYPQVLVNAKVNPEKKSAYLEDSVIVEKIKEVEKEFEGNGRVLIRPSGTEPFVRVMIEGENKEYLMQKATQVASLIEERLNK